MNEVAAPASPRERMTELEKRLRATPRAARPLEHAALRYALGLAYAELPEGDRGLNLSRAVASYRQALALFGPHRFPVEHARVSCALGAALRDLGDLRPALQACERAVELLESTDARADLGAALNNLGLVRSDLGQHEEALEALAAAVEAFAAAGERRQRMMALHNLGQAHAAAGNHAQAAESYQRGLAGADPEDAPYQWGVLEHALGVSLTAIGQGEAAASAFQAALRVFTRNRYPFQHALAKNNLGLAHAQSGDVAGLRHAVSAFEDALGIFDVRLQREQWEQTYRNLELAEAALRERDAGGTRAEHFAALVGDARDEEALELMRERLTYFLSLPDPRRSALLTELDFAIVRQPPRAAARATGVWLRVLMELPNDLLVAGLQARLAAHAALEDEEARTAAAEILERAIAEELMAPQRIRVRDTLEAMGYERP